MFRENSATDMLSKGTSIKVIQEVLGALFAATTRKYYADVKDADRAEMFSKIGVLGNIQQVDKAEIPDQSELQWFQGNCTGKARLSDGYCTLPIKDGKLCGHFLSRQKCYLCSRYITTLEDLEIHRRHLAELQEMLDSNISERTTPRTSFQPHACLKESFADWRNCKMNNEILYRIPQTADSDIMIGNSGFRDDIWDLSPLIPQKEPVTPSAKS